MTLLKILRIALTLAQACGVVSEEPCVARTPDGSRWESIVDTAVSPASAGIVGVTRVGVGHN